MTPPAVTETLNLTPTLTRPVPLPELQQHWQAPPPLETVLSPGRDDDHTPGTLEIADAADEFLNTLNLADTALLRLAAVASTMAPYPTRPPPTPTESSNQASMTPFTSPVTRPTNIGTPRRVTNFKATRRQTKPRLTRQTKPQPLHGLPPNLLASPDSSVTYTLGRMHETIVLTAVGPHQQTDSTTPSTKQCLDSTTAKSTTRT
jgi:hypothetical protein